MGEPAGCGKLLPHCAKCCKVIGEVLDATVNPWLIKEGHGLMQSAEHAARRFVHWLMGEF